MNTSSAKIQVAIILGILGLVGLTLVAHAQDSKKADPIFPVIDMNNASLDAAIDTLARQAKFNYICDPKITGSSATADGNSTLPNVTFRWKNLTAKEALAWLLELHGMAMIENPITSVTRITYTNAPVRRVDISLFGTNTNVVPVVMMMSAPLDRAITQLATQGNLKVVIDPKLSDSSLKHGRSAIQPPKVSFRWEKITARQALAALCENYALNVAKDPASGAALISRADQ